MGTGGLGTTAKENGSIIWLIWVDIASKGFGYSGRILHQKGLANPGNVASNHLANLGGHCIKRIWLIWEDNELKGFG